MYAQDIWSDTGKGQELLGVFTYREDLKNGILLISDLGPESDNY